MYTANFLYHPNFKPPWTPHFSAFLLGKVQSSGRRIYKNTKNEFRFQVPSLITSLYTKIKIKRRYQLTASLSLLVIWIMLVGYKTIFYKNVVFVWFDLSQLDQKTFKFISELVGLIHLNQSKLFLIYFLKLPILCFKYRHYSLIDKAQLCTIINWYSGNIYK